MSALAVDIEKCLSSAKARAALCGCVLKRHGDGVGARRFSISAWNWPPKWFGSLEDAERFVDELERRRGKP